MMGNDSSILIILIVFGCAVLCLVAFTLLCYFSHTRARVVNQLPCCFRNKKIHPPNGDIPPYNNRGEYYFGNSYVSDTSSSDDGAIYLRESSKSYLKKRRRPRLKRWPNLITRSDAKDKEKSFPEIDIKKIRMKSIIGKGNFGYDK